MYCTKCGYEFRNESKFCEECRQPIRKIPTGIVPNALLVKYRRTRIIFWFFLTNLSVVISLSIISGGALLEVAPYLILLGSTFPFIGLFMSKNLAKKVHRITIINPSDTISETEKSLLYMIEELSKASGIKNVPEVGVYPSPDQNAFATGWSRNGALIAFSSSLISDLDESEVYAVAAHEIAHVVNGDMLIMTMIQSVINTFVLIITLPFNLFNILAFFSDEIGALGYWLISMVRALVSVVAIFLGSLIIKAFSRRREFAADMLAARLIGKQYMINALHKIGSVEMSQIPKEQITYAAFKINGKKSIFDIFSTHPSIERRIERLSKQ